MRALVVHGSADLYGSDRACVRIVEAAVDAGWQIDVIIPNDGPLLAPLEATGAAVHVLDPLVVRRADLRWPTVAATPVRWAAAAVGLWQLAGRDRVDLVHTNTAGALGGALIARRLRVPHIWHVHELFWQPRPVVAGFERMLRTADLVLCCSQAVADQFVDARVRARCRVAYTGAEVPPDLPEVQPLSGPGLEVVSVGRINEWKGQEILVAAVGKVIELRPGIPVTLRLIGDVFRTEHHYRQQLESTIARLGLGEVVVLEGDRRDALALVARADIFVLPSRRPEPFGMALVEAMALGRPSIATAAGGPLEIITSGRDGVLVPPADPGAMAAAIVDLWERPDVARRLAGAGRQRAGDFTLDAMATQVMRGWQEALDTGVAGRRGESS